MCVDVSRKPFNLLRKVLMDGILRYEGLSVYRDIWLYCACKIYIVRYILDYGEYLDSSLCVNLRVFVECEDVFLVSLLFGRM
jgi:hypothetical protein